tara:strand:+ start:370 stop:1020 length:651 start_codon:yes stop_codon:yes gene_type:complete
LPKKSNLIWKFFQTYFLPPLCSSCNKNLGYICSQCHNSLNFKINTSTIDSHKHYYLSSYTPQLQNIIQAIKFDQYEKALESVSQHLIKTATIQPLIKQYDAWISIPYHQKKQYQRGYNIIEAIFKPIFDIHAIPLIYPIKRNKQTPSLSKLSKENRKKVLSKAFNYNKNYNINLKNKKIALVDDIVTTQTTMKNCLQLLHDNYQIDTVDCISLIKA